MKLEGRVSTLEALGQDIYKRIEANQTETRILIGKIDRQEEPLSKRVDTIQTLLTTVAQTQSTGLGRGDLIQRDLKQLEERMDRVVQALDNTYNQLQGHLQQPHSR